MTEKAKRVGERFTSLVREGKIENAVAFFEREAVFGDNESAVRPEIRNPRTPPMNELYKGIKD
ncbi:MAG: hypothetical protein IJU94_00170 [Clostridia bacterium]|nr:hypothetical protein [Clostridia bacterium]